jgi:hypothetical protein
MNNGVDKVGVMSNAIDKWREHYTDSHGAALQASTDPDKKQAAIRIESAKDRKRSALACMAATLLLHDKAVIEVTERRAKIRADFEAHGMLLPGYRLGFIGDRPIAIPIDIPLVVKNPFHSALNSTGAHV